MVQIKGLQIKYHDQEVIVKKVVFFVGLDFKVWELELGVQEDPAFQIERAIGVKAGGEGGVRHELFQPEPHSV